jgi:ceramide glucosyltransferase
MFGDGSMGDILAIVLMAGSLCGSAYAMVAILAVERFAALPRPQPAARPPITILKPLYGAEPALYENLRSFCCQDYPTIQVVCGVAGAEDPAVAVVERLKSDLPQLDLTLVIDDRAHGANRKVGNLINMMAVARHDLLVIADSDMTAPPGYLDAIIADLLATGGGLVTCLYIGRPIDTPWARLGALHINHGFLPAVLVARLIGADQGCFGATMALERRTLEAVGGLARFRDMLADDHALGAAVRGLGRPVRLSPQLVATTVDEFTFKSLIQHELRWARTIRSIAPAGFAASAVTYPVALALLSMLAGGITSASVLILAVALAARVLVSWGVDRALGLAAQAWWLVPARDVLSFCIVVASFCGARVAWRGREFRVGPDGRLTPLG